MALGGSGWDIYVLSVWSGIWSVTKSRVGFWMWIWSTRHCELRQKVTVHFNAGKTWLVLFDWSNNTAAIDAKIDRSVLQEKSSFRCWGWVSLLNWIGALILPLLLKLPPEPWFVLWSIFLLRLLYISINLPYSHA